MRMLHRGFLPVVLACGSGPALARSTVPIVNSEHNAIPARSGSARAGHGTVSARSPGRKLAPMKRSPVAIVEVADDTQNESPRCAASSSRSDSTPGREDLVRPQDNGGVRKMESNVGRELR